RRKPHVQRNEIGPGQYVVLRLRRVAARTPRQHLHAQAAAKLGDPRAYAAGSEHTQRLAIELGQHVARPAAVAHVAVDLRDPARDGEHERDGVLGDRIGVGPGRIADGNPVTIRRRKVDVVGAHAPDRNHPEIRALPEYGGGEMCVGADVDGNPRASDAARELCLVVGAALGVYAYVTERARAFVGDRAVEYGREIVG